MKELYIPAPTRKAAALTVQTPRTRISPMSISGAAIRSSLRTQTTNITAAAPTRPQTRASPQPHAEVWVIPSSSRTSQEESSSAPTQSTLPGDLTGDSGTKKTVATVALTVTTSGNQNSQW